MDSFLNRSPLSTVVSRKVISFSEISAVNFIVDWKLLACVMNGLIFCLFTSRGEKTSSMKRFHIVESFVILIPLLIG